MTRNTAPGSRLVSNARGVVFDKDGTLIDLDARWVPMFRAFVDGVVERSGDGGLASLLLGELGIGERRLVPDGPAAVDTLHQIIDRAVTLLVTRGHEPDTARRTVETTVAGLGRAHGPTMPLGDITTALGALRVAGVSIAIATSDDRANTCSEMVELGIDGLVDTVRCADDGGPTKPDPGVLTGIAAEWSCEVGDLVFVGDSANDLATARAAGCPFVVRCDLDCVPPWADDADAIVASIEELVTS